MWQAEKCLEQDEGLGVASLRVLSLNIGFQFFRLKALCKHRLIIFVKYFSLTTCSEAIGK